MANALRTDGILCQVAAHCNLGWRVDKSTPPLRDLASDPDVHVTRLRRSNP